MKIRIQRWGNSLAARIPAAFARSLNLAHGSQVEMAMTKAGLAITPVKAPRPKLSELLSRITTENVHREVEVSKPQGRETW